MDESKVRLNTQGRVRPRKYNSKCVALKKQKLQNEGQDIHPFLAAEVNAIEEETHETNSYDNIVVNTSENVDAQVFKEEQTRINIHKELSSGTEDILIVETDDNRPVTQNDDIVVSETDNNGPETQNDVDNSILEQLMFKLRDSNDWGSDDIEEVIDSANHSDTGDDSDGAHVDEDAPIQPGHSLSLKTAVLLIWLFSMTHSLTSSQMTDLLTLINLFMLNDNPVFKSLYRFKKVFSNFKAPFIKHYYCSFCYTPVSDNLLVCPNGVCSKPLSDKSSKEYFLELPLSTQLAHMFSRKDFREGLKYRNERIKVKPGNIEDIYDSDMYKLLSSDGGMLSKQFENNVSFTLNTDGVPIFKSSKFSIWPIFLMINELPFKMRKHRDNMLLCGLWYGQTKPLVNVFCHPLHQAVTELEKGMKIRTNTEEITVQGFLFCLSCDTPARAMMLNMNQHNGEYACPKCLQKGVNYRTSAGGNIRIFPYQKEEPTLPERVHQQCVDSAEESIEKQTTVNGIKGPSFLMFCPQFDCVKNVGIDYMHLVCLGIVRLLLRLWFGATQSVEDFSLHKLTDIVDSRIKSIKPPHYISRTPRTITEHLKFWKASELRSWLFFYSIPCIMDLLKPNYLYHYCCLVEGLFLLNQASISTSDLERSEKLLQYFVFMFPALYGERYLTINIHSLVHLSKTVQQLGPLWCTSCFSFESSNGELLKCFHGTQYINLQIINAVHIYQLLPSLVGTLSEDSPEMPFVRSLLKKQNDTRMDFSVCGKGHTIHLEPEMRLLLCAFLSKPAINISYHAKACIRGIIYCSKYYSDSTMRNSYTVKYINKKGYIDYGYIIWFAEDISDSDGSFVVSTQNKPFCCISVLKYEPVSFFSRNYEQVTPDQFVESNFLNIGLKFLHVMKLGDKFDIVPLDRIVEMCVCIVINDNVFVCEEPNHKELNL